MTWIIGFLIAYVVIYIIYAVRAKKIVLSPVVALTGGLGQGKTKLAVRYALNRYKFFRLLYAIGIFKEKPEIFTNLPVDLRKPKKMPMHIYNRRPLDQDGKPVDYEIHGEITYNYKDKKLEWKSIILEPGHILKLFKIPEHSVLLIDEIGGFASQFDYDHPIVMEDLQEFIRFFRHWIDGHIFITDQDTSQIVKAVRVRINKFYMLEDFQRLWLFFFKVNVSEMKVSDDLLNVQQVDQDDKPFLFGTLPFKYLTFLNPIFYPFSYKQYDSRAYSINYKPITNEIGKRWRPGLKTDYFLDLPQQAEMKMLYKKQGWLPTDLKLKYFDDWLKRGKPKHDEFPVKKVDEKEAVSSL